MHEQNIPITQPTSDFKSCLWIFACPIEVLVNVHSTHNVYKTPVNRMKEARQLSKDPNESDGGTGKMMRVAENNMCTLSIEG